MVKYMKNKGFTLIELMAIIVILGVIVLVSVPSLVKTINRNQDKKYETFLEDIKIATETYINLNSEDYPNLFVVGNSEIIYVKDLISDGCFPGEKKNPKTDNYIPDSAYVKVTRQSDNTFKYEYYEG